MVVTKSLEALFHGINPFAITWPSQSVRRQHPVLSARRLRQRPAAVRLRLYPPLTLLLCAPGWLIANDPRYSTLAAMSVAALFMGYARPGNLGKLAATLFLFTPRVFFVVDRAWTRSVRGDAHLGRRLHRDPAPEVAVDPIGLFACLKQHMFIGLPALFLLLPRPIDWRATWNVAWKSILVGLGITLPFILWSPHASPNSVLDIREVYRLDCLSILSYLANTNVVTLSKWSGLIAIIPVIALGLWRAPRTRAASRRWSPPPTSPSTSSALTPSATSTTTSSGALCLAAAVWKAPDAVAQPALVPVASPPVAQPPVPAVA